MILWYMVYGIGRGDGIMIYIEGWYYDIWYMAYIERWCYGMKCDIEVEW